ncbi:noncompact myelin-associated protein [Phyllostomus hastatus]|uniref:noncompact myelin-associated protein n=1 Tax=Phyllostomus hastatus TaxID=9423 RepID=UPI001E6804A8|nr:noncompact myelin-associated protein [Phyllostomus hastatus]XP_045715449.1 noncompact myelin-associated protein [Phyllostomus hastatus]
MTTAAPTGTTPFFSLNVTTKEEDSLYKSSGAIVAGVVVVVVLLLTAVLYVLKRYNSTRRIAGTFSSSPYATGAQQGATPAMELKEIEPEKMRAKRELEPKGAKPASFSAQGPKRGGGKHSASVTFSPVDVQMKIR